MYTVHDHENDGQNRMAGRAGRYFRSVLSLVLNLLLTGGFVVIVKRLAQQAYGLKE